MAQPQGQPPRHVGAPIQPPPQANPQVLVGELVAGPLNQPLFGQLVGRLSPYDPSGRLSFTGWFQIFANFCLMNGVEEEPLDEQGQPLLVPSVAKVLLPLIF